MKHYDSPAAFDVTAMAEAGADSAYMGLKWAKKRKRPLAAAPLPENPGKMITDGELNDGDNSHK